MCSWQHRTYLHIDTPSLFGQDSVILATFQGHPNIIVGGQCLLQASYAGKRSHFEINVICLAHFYAYVISLKSPNKAWINDHPLPFILGLSNATLISPGDYDV